jgi:ADP-ribose pyrophosphatase
MSAPEILLQSRKFRVERRRVAAADGSITASDFVVHPGAAVILPLLDDGRILMIENVRHAVGRSLLELPAGTLDPDERPEVCAARELEEETGYSAEHWSELTSFFATPGISNEQMFIYIACRLKAGPPRRESTESITNRPISWDEALQAVRTGEIVDAKSIIGLLYYSLYVRPAGGDVRPVG